MALAELIGKIRAKRQAENRTTFGHYLEAVRTLASGGEIDADEVGHIIAAAGKDEESLEADVNLQQQRLQHHATMMRNRQSAADRQTAERELERAQAELDEAVRRLQPKVAAARAKLDDANHAALVTQGAEAWLGEHVLDIDLLERERAIGEQLRGVVTELKPLLADQTRLKESLTNEQYRLSRLQGREPSNQWTGLGGWLSRVVPNEEPLKQKIADIENQLSQLESVIRPRQQEQRRLQAELESIYRQKLEP